MRIAGLLLLLVVAAMFCPDTAPAEDTALARVSGLPVFYIDMDTGDMPGDAYALGRLTAVYTRDSVVVRETARVKLRERGNTSRRFPKKSYRLSIVDEAGDKRNLSLAGLRRDDDWILNPMYADTSKVREKLAYAVWDVMNSSGAAARSTRLEHAEVYFNGEYWGLYGVQERVDRKQVSGDKRDDVLYKVIANDRPTVEELLSCTSDTQCRGIELSFAGADVGAPWHPAASYMAFLSGESDVPGATLSEANIIDFGLFAMVTQAHDCHFKNQFLHAVWTGRGYTLYKLPWDLNNTFGDVWLSDAADTNYTGYLVGALVWDSAFKKLLDAGDKALYERVQARWAALRAGAITQDALIAMARAIYDPLFDAIARDGERWRHGGMGEGNARNIRDIEEFICDVLPRVDAAVANLTEE